MLEVDVKGRIYDYHAPADELLYVPSEAFIGKSVEEILPKEAADICLKAIERAAQKGWFRGSTYSLDLPRGSRWFEMSIDVKSRVEGKADRLLIISRDITDRILAEETIKRERDSAQMYLDVVNTIVVAVSKKGHVIMINKYGAKLLGYPEEEIVGKSWFETFVPYHERRLVKKVHSDIIAGKLEGAKKFENMVVCRGGEEKLISWHNEYVTSPNGEFLFTLSAGEDITEMQAARYELKENYGRLE
jgi:two-component system, cell cycle sensor histidine kinase and response regulator CckA